MATLKEIQDFIKAVSKIGISEVSVITDDLKIKIKVTDDKETKKNEASYMQQMPMNPQFFQQIPMGPPIQATTTNTTPVEFREQEEKEDKKYKTIKSPMVGTFYRRPSPDKPPYINIGDEIAEGQVVCIIEAMKLFNEIESEISGKIIKILVEDASPVEFDQPLFLVEP